MSWALLPLAYLLGAFPSSYVAGRLKGIDLRQHGSGNLGATNAFRILGWRAAVPVMIGDVAKGWVPAALFPLWAGAEALEWPVAYGGAAILGHVYSVFMGFKGGKGVATSAGVFLALAPWAAMIGAIVWGVSVLLTRIVSVGSLLAALVFPVAVFATNEPRMVFWVSVAVAAFVIFVHRANVGRLLRGEENRFGRNAERAG